MAAPAENIEKEMAITHQDFHRIFARAFGDVDYSVDGDRYLLNAAGRQLEIKLGAQRVRKIARLELPTTTVRFGFSGYAVEQRQAFLDRFDLAFQRGGG